MSKTDEYQVLPKSCVFALRTAFGPQAGTVISTITKWIQSNGIEWTVTRLKNLRVAALQLRAGNPLIVKQIYQDNSIAYRRDLLFPRGPYKAVFRAFQRAQRPCVLRKLEVVLRAYTGLQLQEVSQKQADKAKQAITSPYQGSEEELSKMESLLSAWVQDDLLGHLFENGLVEFDFHQRRWSPKIGNRNLSHLKAYSSYHRSKTPNGIRKMPFGMAATSIATTTYWPRPLPVDYRIEEYIRSLVWDKNVDNDFVGHIAFLQEGGAKARVVAVPTCLSQWAFEPLHTWLDKVLRTLPGSCVHDQNSGAFFMKANLEMGDRLWCFDLSSATDRFPRSLQTAVLKALELTDYADALDDISSESWAVKQGPYAGESWSYSVGQPMGLYASFPLFTLAHYGVLATLCNELGIHTSTPFRIIGDDVLINDPGLAKMYERTLSDLGVEISPTKTLQSCDVAEFAGFVGYRTNKSVAVFRPYKHGCCKDIHNPIGLLAALGTSLGRWSNYWKVKVKAFLTTRGWRMPDLSPILPDEDGSEGVNPPIIDTTRLGNLLTFCLKECTSGRNTWTGELFEWESIEDLVDILLDKQETEDFQNLGHRPDLINDLLSTPVIQDSKEYSVESKISNDPVLKLFTPELEIQLEQSSSVTVSKDADEAPPCQHLIDEFGLELVTPETVPSGGCAHCTITECLLAGAYWDPRLPEH